MTGSGPWIFGYGSLMWRPGFAYVERRPALVRGYHRSFCVYSHVHRGTPDRPGLVFGLDRGGSCRGWAFRVRPGDAEQVKDYLRAREQVTLIYREVTVPLCFLDGARERAQALCFIVDRSHHQYAGKLDFDRQVELIARGQGQSGANPDYLQEMVQHLREVGIHDAGLERLHSAVSRRLQRRDC